MADIRIKDTFLDEEVMIYSPGCKNIRKDEKPSDWIKRLKDSKS
jgi:hypothetical protein